MAIKNNGNHNVWVLSEYFYPEQTPTSYYITEIAKHFAINGFTTKVICSNSSINIKVENSKFEQYAGLTIHRVSSPNLSKDKLVQRLFKLVITSIMIFVNACFKIKKHDVVFVATNPAFLILFMPILKAIKRIKYYIIVHDVFPENLVVINDKITGSIFYKFLKKIFNSAYASADCCLTIGRDMSEVILKKTRNKAKTECINIWSDDDTIKPIAKEQAPLYKSLQLSNKFILEFAGNFGKAQGIEQLLESALKLKDSNIHFLFIGDGACKALIERYIDEYNLNNISLIGYQKREAQIDFLNCCDVAIVSLKSKMYGLGVPSKAYNYMAAGKPILFIGDKYSEIDRCIKEYNIGYSVNSNSVDDLVKAILNLASKSQDLIDKGLLSRKLAEEEFSKAKTLNKFLDFCCTN